MPGAGHDSRRRDQIRDPREEILLETNFDDDGAVMTRAYSQNNGTRNGFGSAAAAAPANRRRNQYRSDVSIDRFSEASLHGNRYRGATHCVCSVRSFCVSFSYVFYAQFEDVSAEISMECCMNLYVWV